MTTSRILISMITLYILVTWMSLGNDLDLCQRKHGYDYCVLELRR